MKECRPNGWQHVLICEVYPTVQSVLADNQTILRSQNNSTEAFGVLFALCDLIVNTFPDSPLLQEISFFEPEVNVSDMFIDSLFCSNRFELLFAFINQ